MGGWSLKYPAGTTGISGIPDLQCYYKGVAILVEVKAPKNYVIDELQKAQIRRIRRNGTIAIVSNDLEDIKTIVIMIDEYGLDAVEMVQNVGLYK